jgi:hypothetical protein
MPHGAIYFPVVTLIVTVILVLVVKKKPRK